MYLTHSTPHTIEGNVLKPAPCKNVAGLMGSFVFASSELFTPYAYALKSPDMFSLIEEDMGFAACFVRAQDRDSMKAREGTIYKLPYENFTPVVAFGRQTQEWVATCPVPVVPEQSMKVDFDYAMQKGVQFFFVQPDKEALCRAMLFGADFAGSLPERMARVVKDEVAVHENAAMKHSSAVDLDQLARKPCPWSTLTLSR